MQVLLSSNLTLYKKQLNAKVSSQVVLRPHQQSNKHSTPILYPYNFPNINYGRIPFQGIKLISISRDLEGSKESIISEIKTFAMSKTNATYIGSGVSANAYTLNKMPNIVLKKAFSKKETFEAEEKNIKLVPEYIKNSQKFVARAYDDIEGHYYILSTKVNGESPNPINAPWTTKHLKNLFNTMLEFDKIGLYHGDLNGGNMKLTQDGDVNFLDYQWASQVQKQNYFDSVKVDKQTLPKFIHCENSQMFEMAELPYYLKAINNPGEAKNFLRLYLSEKAVYHKNRATFIKKETVDWPYSSEREDIQNGLDFETAQAIILASPTDAILKLETKKLQFLNTFREAYKRIDKNVEDKNIIGSGSAFLTALNSVQDFRFEIAKQKNNAQTQVEKAYLKGQEKYGHYWFENLKNWTIDAYDFPIRHITKKIANWEKSFYNFENPNIDIEQFGALTNVISRVDERYLPHYNKNFSATKSIDAQHKMNELKKLFSEFEDHNMDGHNIAEITLAQRKLEKAYRLLNKAYSSNWGMDIVNTSLLCALRAEQLKTIALKYYYPNGKMTKENSENIRKLLSEVKDNTISLANSCFNNMFKEIVENDPNSEGIIGYANMGNFQV